MNFTVTVTLGCYNRIPETGWLRNSRILFVMELEAGKSELVARMRLGSGETPVLSGLKNTAFSACPYTVEQDGVSSPASLYEDTDPSHEGPTLKP